MDTISRLIALLLFVMSGSAFAGPRDYYDAAGHPVWYQTAAAGCAAVGAPTGNHVFDSVYIPPGYGDAYWQCIFKDITIPPPNTVQHGGGTRGTCPENKLPNFIEKTCVDAPPPEEPPSCPVEGTKEGTSENAYTTTQKIPSNNLCIGQCSWSAGGVVPSVCANGKCYYYGPFTSNGVACTGDGGGGIPPEEPDEAPPGDAQCVAKGQCPATVNGVKVCVPCSSKEGTTSESGSSSGSGTDSSGNPTGETGSTNTTKETTANCTNGSCSTTTTTTVTNPDGSTTTTTETESKPQADFCKANPGHIVCKGEDEGTFGGSCASDFQCSGDAVQCAQAREVAKLRCVFDVSPDDPLVVAGGLAMNDQLTPAGHPGAPGSGISVNVMDKIEEAPVFGSSGNCISDRTFSVIGMSLTLPFASMCPYFNMIGNVFLSCCYLVAGFIVFRR